MLFALPQFAVQDLSFGDPGGGLDIFNRYPNCLHVLNDLLSFFPIPFSMDSMVTCN